MGAGLETIFDIHLSDEEKEDTNMKKEIDHKDIHTA